MPLGHGSYELCFHKISGKASGFEDLAWHLMYTSDRTVFNSIVKLAYDF